MKPARVQALEVAVAATDHSTVYRGEASGNGLMHDQAIRAMNTPNNLELFKLWEVALEQPVFSSPATVACTGGNCTACYVLFATIQAEVYAVDALCGSFLWKTVLSGQVFADLSVGFTQQRQPGGVHGNPAHQTQQTACASDACVLVAANAPGHNVVLNVLNGSVLKFLERASEAVTSAAPSLLWQERLSSGVCQHQNWGEASGGVSETAPVQWLVTYGDGGAQVVTACCAKQIEKFETPKGVKRECRAAAEFACGVASFSGALWMDRHTVLVGCRDDTVRLQKVSARAL